jgi:hypothetical protein
MITNQKWTINYSQWMFRSSGVPFAFRFFCVIRYPVHNSSPKWLLKWIIITSVMCGTLWLQFFSLRHQISCTELRSKKTTQMNKLYFGHAWYPLPSVFCCVIRYPVQKSSQKRLIRWTNLYFSHVWYPMPSLFFAMSLDTLYRTKVQKDYSNE